MPDRLRPTLRLADQQRITEARASSPLLTLTAYCRQPACPAREIEIRIKDYDHDLQTAMAAHGLTCPVCRQALVLHHVQTAEQHARAEAHAARCEVNVQMYVRDVQQPLVAIPAGVLGDDRLPPTPAGWFTAQSQRPAGRPA